MELADLKGEKIMLAVSGGLDSCTITHWLVEQGVEVVAYTAELGQPDEKKIAGPSSGLRPSPMRTRASCHLMVKSERLYGCGPQRLATEYGGDAISSGRMSGNGVFLSPWPIISSTA